MNIDVFRDVADMHRQFEFHEAVDKLSVDDLRTLLEFRKNFLREEMREIEEAETADDVVDGLIDLIVVAVGTLDIFKVDSHTAWNRVHAANLAKRRGIKSSRPNPLGLPDLVKPDGWVAPEHVDNVGRLGAIFDQPERREPT